MLRRDYIQRMIEEYARVLTEVLGLRKEGRNEEAVRLLQEGYETFFNENAADITVELPSHIVQKFVDAGLTAGQMEIFADGLKTEGELLEDTDPETATNRYIRALALYEYVESADKSSFSIPRRSSIAFLKVKTAV